MDIDFINSTRPTVVDDADMQEQFEQNYNLTNGVDVGELMVYNLDGKVTGVYDYANFVGWVVT